MTGQSGQGGFKRHVRSVGRQSLHRLGLEKRHCMRMLPGRRWGVESPRTHRESVAVLASLATPIAPFRLTEQLPFRSSKVMRIPKWGPLVCQRLRCQTAVRFHDSVLESS